MREYQEALENYDKALKIDPDLQWIRKEREQIVVNMTKQAGTVPQARGGFWQNTMPRLKFFSK
jgi:tetratricopeptide (TPR) repeat protein